MNTTITRSVSVASKSFQKRKTPTTDGVGGFRDPTLAAAKSGTLTTRTDANTGILTVASGHGFNTSDRIDLFFGGLYRYGMSVTGTTATTVSIDGGTGDDLPDLNTTGITCMKPQLEDFVVETADLQGLYVTCASPALAIFLDDTDAVVKAVYVGGSTDAFIWEIGDVTDLGAENPFASGDVVSVYLSHGGTVSREITAVATAN
jgi:hypothetical protein